MNYRQLGHTDLRVCPLCLGGNVFGWTTDEQASFAVLDAYVEAGGNFIDTADTYSRFVPGNTGGESETILGRWMKACGNRERMVIATKVGGRMSDDPPRFGLSRRYILEEVETSLRRLQTDSIDLYFAHFDDPNTSLDETLGAFNDLIKSGKVRHIGASNYSAARLRAALVVSHEDHYVRYEVMQPRYNLMNRAAYEDELEPLCREEGLGVIVYSSLAGGFLTGKYHLGQEMPKTARAASVERNYMKDERSWYILDELERVAHQYNATPSQAGLAWILSRPGITGPIASATSASQVHELLGALDLSLDHEALRALDQASAS